MKAYSLIIIFIGCIWKYTSVDIMSEFKRNILNFEYGINFKYEGNAFCICFDRYYVVTNFILPTIEDNRFFTDYLWFTLQLFKY